MTDNPERNKRILVVDDTELFLALMEELLTKEGFEVIQATDGLEAVEKAKQELPNLDLVLLDLLLPKMTGFDALREIRKHEAGENLPVLAISNVFKEAAQMEELRTLGASGFISKDLSPEEIVNRVKRALGIMEA